jgi:hypothetical protein
MDTRSRSRALTIPWYRAITVWMVIMLIETAHGAVREWFIAPAIGDVRARQVGVPIGCVIIFVVALFATRWLGAASRRQQLSVGGLWVVLTLGFEFVIGRAVGSSWDQLLADYDPARGGLMLLGLAFLFVTPMLVAPRYPRETST